MCVCVSMCVFVCEVRCARNLKGPSVVFVFVKGSFFQVICKLLYVDFSDDRKMQTATAATTATTRKADSRDNNTTTTNKQQAEKA